MALHPSWNGVKTDVKFPVAAGTELTLSCKAGYRLEGDKTVTCTKDTEFTYTEVKPKCGEYITDH